VFAAKIINEIILPVESNLNSKKNNTAIMFQSANSMLAIAIIAACVSLSHASTPGQLATHKLTADFDGLLTGPLLASLRYSPDTTRYIHLAKKRITSVQPDCLTPYTRLKYLDLASNQLTAVALNNTSLEHLILRDNRLTSADVLLGLSGLRRLDLSDNRLKSIVLAGHASLEQLDLSFNKLSALTSEAVGKLPSLSHLDLSSNYLTRIRPGTFGQPSRNILTLNLASNQLSYLDQNVFEHLTGLVELNLSDNLLQTLPRGLFEHLASLRVLKLAWNSLKTLSFYSFVGVPLLNDLDLSNNQLKAIHADSFKSVKKLIDLDLSDNRLEALNDTNLFRHTPDLSALLLDNNELREVAVGTLEKVNLLRTVHLSGYLLSTIDARVFRGLGFLEVVLLEWNLFGEGEKARLESEIRKETGFGGLIVRF